MPDCLFCRIASREVDSDVVYEDDEFVAFRDINPQTPVHVLLIPRKHIAGFNDSGSEDEAMLGRLLRTAGRVAEEQGIAGSGFRSVINNGPDAQQSVPHLHLHVLGGRGMTWPPG